MTKILRTVGVSVALAVVSFMSGQASAMPVGGSGKAALAQIGVIEQAQYSYGGKDYCWYDDGWNGPGWYVCGQYTVSGVGWGGAAGWHGWTHTSGTVVRGGNVSGRTGGGRTGGQVSGRTGGGRTGASGRTGGGRTGASGRTGGGRTGTSGRTGGGRTGGGRTGGGRGGGRRH
jgi:hypothetical protein